MESTASTEAWRVELQARLDNSVNDVRGERAAQQARVACAEEAVQGSTATLPLAPPLAGWAVAIAPKK